MIEKSDLVDNPSEILPDNLEMIPENSSIEAVEDLSEYEKQRMENINNKNTFLEKSKVLDHKISSQKRKRSPMASSRNSIQPAKKSKFETLEPVKKSDQSEVGKRVMPKRGATKSQMSYAEYHEEYTMDSNKSIEMTSKDSDKSTEMPSMDYDKAIEMPSMDCDKSTEMPSLPPALLAANPDLANIASGNIFLKFCLPGQNFYVYL